MALDSGLAINNTDTDTESTIGVALESTHSDSYTHETNSSLTKGSVMAFFRAGLTMPLSGEFTG